MKGTESLCAALDGWETRDSDGQEPCSVERGTLGGGNLEVVASGLTYKQADALEAALYAAHSALAVVAENAETEVDGTRSAAVCTCGHAARNHVMASQTQRCEATIYTDAPLGGGSAYPCPCRQFEDALSRV